jgi:hypothetical protein
MSAADSFCVDWGPPCVRLCGFRVSTRSSKFTPMNKRPCPRDMEIVPQIGAGTIDGLSYLGSLVTLKARAAYYTLVAAFRGKPLRLERAISQAMEVGVRCLPILSLITFFIGLILALQAAYELRRFGAMNAVATAVARTTLGGFSQDIRGGYADARSPRCDDW